MKKPYSNMHSIYLFKENIVLPLTYAVVKCLAIENVFAQIHNNIKLMAAYSKIKMEKLAEIKRFHFCSIFFFSKNQLILGKQCRFPKLLFFPWIFAHCGLLKVLHVYVCEWKLYVYQNELEKTSLGFKASLTNLFLSILDQNQNKNQFQNLKICK